MQAFNGTRKTVAAVGAVLALLGGGGTYIASGSFGATDSGRIEAVERDMREAWGEIGSMDQRVATLEGSLEAIRQHLASMDRNLQLMLESQLRERGTQ